MRSRRIVALMVPVAGIMALGFVDRARRDYDTCFYLGLSLLFWGIGCCLVGTFLCAILFAVCRALPVAYRVLVAGMVLVAAVGYSLGYADCLQGQEGSVLVYAWLFLVASLVGLVPGYGLGRGA